MNLFPRYIKSKIWAAALSVLTISGFTVQAYANPETGKFTIVLDAGHGGKDHGAIDNGAKEKDINLDVALRVGELCKKKLKDTKIIFTRDDDNFISLQGRADIANKSKADLFISIHTNSVDAKNKNRKSVAGATVYTQGPHKDDANLSVARRENAVIEMENGFEQKYSGFDPNKDESYIIFEMAQKKNLSESNRFAKSVQDNLVKIAGRRDRGVHQAGFWVLWSTSMPSVLVELDFICNPESAKFMTSKDGIDKLAEAIFQSIKIFEQNYMQKQRMIASGKLAPEKKSGKQSDENEVKEAPSQKDTKVSSKDKRKEDPSKKKQVSKKKKKKKNKKSNSEEQTSAPIQQTSSQNEEEIPGVFAIAIAPKEENKDLSHNGIAATKNQKRARTTADGRRRRSEKARLLSEARNLSVNDIHVATEFTGLTSADKNHKTQKPSGQNFPTADNIAEETNSKLTAADTNGSDTKVDGKKVAQKGSGKQTASSTSDSKKSKRDWVTEINERARKNKQSEKDGKISKSSESNSQSAEKSHSAHAGSRKSLKSKN